MSKHRKSTRQMVKEPGKAARLLEDDWEEVSREDFKESIPISIRRKKEASQRKPRSTCNRQVASITNSTVGLRHSCVALDEIALI